MVQTLSSYKIFVGEKRIVLKKPYVLQRIFFSISVILRPDEWYDMRISFDDPKFTSFFYLSGARKWFEAEGADIFQGNVWVYNASNTDIWVSLSEILH